MKLDKPLNLTFTQPAQQHASHALQAIKESETGGNEALIKELQDKKQLIDTQKLEISELKIKNRQLQIETQETKERQKLLDEELRKAENQIELIMELVNENKELSN